MIKNQIPESLTDNIDNTQPNPSVVDFKQKWDGLKNTPFDAYALSIPAVILLIIVQNFRLAKNYE